MKFQPIARFSLSNCNPFNPLTNWVSQPKAPKNEHTCNRTTTPRLHLPSKTPHNPPLLQTHYSGTQLSISLGLPLLQSLSPRFLALRSQFFDHRLIKKNKNFSHQRFPPYIMLSVLNNKTRKTYSQSFRIHPILN